MCLGDAQEFLIVLKGKEVVEKLGFSPAALISIQIIRYHNAVVFCILTSKLFVLWDLCISLTCYCRTATFVLKSHTVTLLD